MGLETRAASARAGRENARLGGGRALPGVDAGRDI